MPFLAAAMVTGGTVTILGWPAVTTQPAAQILSILREMGADCVVGPDGLTVTGTARDSAGSPPTWLTAARSRWCSAPSRPWPGSPSVLTGIGHQRHQETDRLAALATEINALGGDVTERPTGWRSGPGR